MKGAGSSGKTKHEIEFFLEVDISPELIWPLLFVDVPSYSKKREYVLVSGGVAELLIVPPVVRRGISVSIVFFFFVFRFNVWYWISTFLTIFVNGVLYTMYVFVPTLMSSEKICFLHPSLLVGRRDSCAVCASPVHAAYLACAD